MASVHNVAWNARDTVRRQHRKAAVQLEIARVSALLRAGQIHRDELDGDTIRQIQELWLKERGWL